MLLIQNAMLQYKGVDPLFSSHLVYAIFKIAYMHCIFKCK